MKKILITGVSSYIGTSLEKWLSKHQDCYLVDSIDVKNPLWREKDFSKYDSILHVAGIAHVSQKSNMRELYYKVNRDLAIDIAGKAKRDSVKQFIFMSSIIVYGDKFKTITKETIPKPENYYGKSKLEAEEGIRNLESIEFKVVILRTPMVYGKKSKGNYPTLAKISSKLPIFPDICNKRSMIHIDNLCEFIRLTIDNNESGIFFPQNKDYVKTSDMVKLIAMVHGKNIKLTSIFNPLLVGMIGKVKIITKIFGDLVYEQQISIYKEEYRVRDFHESILMTEKNL